jgi:hypothetical protein
MSRPLIVCCSPDYGDGWRRLGPSITGDAVEWVYFDDRPVYFWERWIRRHSLGNVRACFSAARLASKGKAKLLITQEPRVTSLCALFCRLLGVRVNHYVFSLNFPALPGKWRSAMMRYSFKQIQQFSVHSSMERDLYSRHFDIPEDRIGLRLWSIGVPDVSHGGPLYKGRYVSAIGGNGRDYQTLLQAALLLPDIPFVLVVRPENLAGMSVPSNVKAVVNAPFEEAMNAMRYSEFTVLPLSGSQVPCGHVTLVCAMHLGRAVVATDSAGIYDYVHPGYNGILCQPFSAESLAESIRCLWNTPVEIERLARNNHSFGTENCSEERMRTELASVLSSWDITLQSEMSRSVTVKG